jgi:hypothetical protein
MAGVYATKEAQSETAGERPEKRGSEGSNGSHLLHIPGLQEDLDLRTVAGGASSAALPAEDRDRQMDPLTRMLNEATRLKQEQTPRLAESSEAPLRAVTCQVLMTPVAAASHWSREREREGAEALERERERELEEEEQARRQRVLAKSAEKARRNASIGGMGAGDSGGRASQQLVGLGKDEELAAYTAAVSAMSPQTPAGSGSISWGDASPVGSHEEGRDGGLRTPGADSANRSSASTFGRRDSSSGLQKSLTLEEEQAVYLGQCLKQSPSSPSTEILATHQTVETKLFSSESSARSSVPKLDLRGVTPPLLVEEALAAAYSAGNTSAHMPYAPREVKGGQQGQGYMAPPELKVSDLSDGELLSWVAGGGKSGEGAGVGGGAGVKAGSCGPLLWLLSSVMLCLGRRLALISALLNRSHRQQQQQQQQQQ